MGSFAKDVSVRLVFGFVMGVALIALVASGIVTVLPLIAVAQIFTFLEILNVNGKSPSAFSRCLEFYFLGITLFWANACATKDVALAAFPQLRAASKYGALAMFSCFAAGFVAFVSSLDAERCRQQITRFAWMIMGLFVAGLGSFYVASMRQGMAWFLIPTTCVIQNDVWAYFWGKFFGRRQLTRLSPRKTWEGFLGAWFFTVLWSIWVAGFLRRFFIMTCPFSHSFFPTPCSLPARFEVHEFEIPLQLRSLLPAQPAVAYLSLAQLDAVVIACFTSLVSPFGGFFASAVKRAHSIKDFGTLIPGHGGMTDRMDCQILTGVFIFVYVHTVLS